MPINWLRRLLSKQPASPPISRQDALRVFPVHNPQLEWELDEEGMVTATLVRRQDLKGRLLSAFLMVPESRQMKLDAVGTFVWNLCDGEHTVNDIVEAMCDQYKLSRREIEVSLTEFLRLLGKRGMIAVAVPEEIVEKLDPDTAKALGLEKLEVIDESGESPEAGDSEKETRPSEDSAGLQGNEQTDSD